ncbi:MAG: putative DNA-binding domain-containing protein [Gammaproteobacteria bacterium]|nr:putative DNA-binding domain-containing protein [Gammaproteobacteria bacterium]
MTNANMIHSNDFQTHQRAFTHWIRHSEHAPLPDHVSAERMTIYRELIFNNISSFIEHTYPVTQALLPTEIWDALTHLFFQQGQCDSPYYYDISMHFKDFIDQEEFNSIESLHSLHQTYSWLRELMQYEWMELYVDMAETSWLEDNSSESSNVDIQQLSPDHSFTLKTTCWILAYQYPVHTWSTTTQLADIQITPTCLLIYRNRSDEMQVHPLHPLWAFLLETIQNQENMHFDKLTAQLQEATQLAKETIDEITINLLSWLKTLTLLHVNIS